MPDLRTDWKTEDERREEYQEWYETHGLAWNRMIARRQQKVEREKETAQEEKTGAA